MEDKTSMRIKTKTWERDQYKHQDNVDSNSGVKQPKIKSLKPIGILI